MSKQNEGALPAFPVFCDQTDQQLYGLTIRDYFAAKAMQGLITKHGYVDGDLHLAASCSYEVADAMLAARERQS